MNKEVTSMKYALPFRLVSLLAALAMVLPVAAQEDTKEGGLTGTGIYGVIATAEPFVVNGRTVSISDAVIVADAVGLASTQDLQAGNVVALRVDTSASVIDAVSVQRIFAMIGPVQAMSDDHLTIMGTDITVSDIHTTATQPGDWVAVSGFWQETDLIATRIDSIAPQEFARMTGTYFTPADGEGPSFGTSQLFGLSTDDLDQGSVLNVLGHPSREGIQVVAHSVGLFDEDVGYVLAQGYLSRPKADGFYTLIGSGLIAFSDDQDMPASTRLVLSCGIEGILFKPDLMDVSNTDGANLMRLGC